MSARYEVGELVDIQIKRAEVVGVETGTDTVMVNYPLGTPTTLYDLAVMLSPSVTVTRVAPAEWPPRAGDLWANAHGVKVFAQDRVLFTSNGFQFSVEEVLEALGPMTLVYREGWTPAPAVDVDQADEPKLDERAAKIAGLREMADWLDAHPDLPLRSYTSGLVLSHFVDDHDDLERLAVLFGVDPDPRTDNPHPGNPHRYARKTFSAGVKIEAVICNAYPEPAAVDSLPAAATDITGVEEVAGPVDVAGPATAPDFDLSPLPDEDGDLIAPVAPNAHFYCGEQPALCPTGEHAPAVESDADALDQLGVAATDPGEVQAAEPLKGDRFRRKQDGEPTIILGDGYDGGWDYTIVGSTLGYAWWISAEDLTQEFEPVAAGVDDTPDGAGGDPS